MEDSLGKLEAACLASRHPKLEVRQGYQTAVVVVVVVVVVFAPVELEG